MVVVVSPAIAGPPIESSSSGSRPPSCHAEAARRLTSRSRPQIDDLERKPMARYQTSFSSPTSTEAAFSYLSRFSTTAEWDPGVVEARDLTPDPVGVGSAFEVVSSVPRPAGPAALRDHRVRCPPAGRAPCREPRVRSIDTISCEPRADGSTVVSYDAVLEPRGAVRLMAPLLAILFRRIGDRAADGLRANVDRLAVAERRPTPEDPHERPIAGAGALDHRRDG